MSRFLSGSKGWKVKWHRSVLAPNFFCFFGLMGSSKHSGTSGSLKRAESFSIPLMKNRSKSSARRVSRSKSTELCCTPIASDFNKSTSSDITNTASKPIFLATPIDHYLIAVLINSLLPCSDTGLGVRPQSSSH